MQLTLNICSFHFQKRDRIHLQNKNMKVTYSPIHAVVNGSELNLNILLIYGDTMILDDSIALLYIVRLTK